MNYLSQGCVSQETLDLLFELRSFTSENIKKAISAHLVPGERYKAGRTLESAALLNDVDKSNLNKALTKLNETAAIVEKLKERAWPRYSEFVKSLEVTKVTTLKVVE